jgi:hypothetical protein
MGDAGMRIETVRLEGGPCDGDLMSCAGSNRIYFAEKPPGLSILSDKNPSPEKIEFRRHVYERCPHSIGVFKYKGLER